MSTIALAVHGGAGTISPDLMTPAREKAYRDALEHALRMGHNILLDGGAAINQAAVRAVGVSGAVVGVAGWALWVCGRVLSVGEVMSVGL